MNTRRQQLYHRIRNLRMLHKFLINNRSYNYLATEYKIRVTSIDAIIRKQIIEYNFYILQWNKTLDINVPVVSKDGLKGLDAEYRLFNYLYKTITALRDLLIEEEIWP